uniref:Uncharacterized protein n=1 Tax=Arundo donax TaxID=35708 RepID=A0A0A9A9R1_ARUDO
MMKKKSELGGCQMHINK